MSRDFIGMVRRREVLLLAIEVHGPSVVYERIAEFRRIAHSRDVFGMRQIKQALIDGGMDVVDVENLANSGHSVVCACWRCIIMLRKDVERAARKRQNL